MSEAEHMARVMEQRIRLELARLPAHQREAVLEAFKREIMLAEASTFKPKMVYSAVRQELGRG